MTISGSMLRQLSDGLAELYAPVSAPGSLDYAARVVRLATRLVPADSCSYNHIGGGPRLLAWLIEPADVGTFPGGIQLFQQHLPEHPLVAHIQATGDGRARRISDFLSDRQFRSLGLYHDFYRRCGVEYALLTQPGPVLSPDSEASPLLTPRQAHILQLVADGQSDRGIARTLGISTRTVQAHLQQTYRALDVTSRTEAVARLRALGAMPALNRPGRRVRS